MDKQLNRALYALGLMWNQYCGERGHLFMSAGEEASGVLMEHGLLQDEWSEADWEKLEKLIAEENKPSEKAGSE